METVEKRKYRGGDFRITVGASVSPATFCEIEELAQAYSMSKAAVVRRLVLLGLAEYRRDGKFLTQPMVPPEEPATVYYSTAQPEAISPSGSLCVRHLGNSQVSDEG